MLSDIGEDMIFLYADGASRGNPGPAAYGVHIVDSSGQLIADLGEQLGIATNNQAEYSGVIAGLRFLTTTDHRTVTIRLDSKLVVEQLSGRWKIKNPGMQELAIEAQGLLSGFDAKFEWVPREENAEADANANRALDEGDFSTQASANIALATIQPRSIRAPRQLKEPTTIAVVRHGHTVNTEKNLISGGDGTDPELSELGLFEARAAAEQLPILLSEFGLPELSRVYHSPMLRTTQTGEAIAATKLELTADSRLKEIGFGDWEMLEMAQLETDEVELVKSWRGSLDVAPPNGESVMDMQERVWSALDEIIEDNRGKSVAVATHMMPTRAFAAAAFKGARNAYFNINSSPGGISIYRFFDMEFAEVFVLNSCQHLIRN
jgi:broad specificity phosphatase PhoE/ribonuclease HI